MASSFVPEPPVLTYDPRPDPDTKGRDGQRVWVCWPSWAYRVVAPDPELSERINVLQKAVLRMLHAGRFMPAELGERLGIHPELASFVIAELQDQCLVTQEGTVTSSGSAWLEKERERSARLKVGWVFKDPWNGNLWPFVTPVLQYAQVIQRSRKHIILELGTTGNSRSRKAWVVQHPPSGPGAAPNADEILQAAFDHERRRFRQHEEHASVQADTASEVFVDGMKDQIASIEEDPTPVYLASFLYSDGVDWHACDFFGRGSNTNFRRLVFKETEMEQNLNQQLDRIGHNTRYGSVSEYRKEEETRQRQARKKLELILTRDIFRCDVAKSLKTMIEGWLELKDLEDSAGSRHYTAVLLFCRITLEQLFREIAQSWSLVDVGEQFCRDNKTNAAVIEAAVKKVGFNQLPNKLRHIPYGHVVTASKMHTTWRLRATVVATLVCASSTEGHPLRSAAEAAPDLLKQIDDIASYGGQAAHGGEQQYDFTLVDFALVREIVQKTLNITGLLLNMPVRLLEEV